ncbi:MAG: hypothetical protein ACXWHI_12255 [Candidatus Aminicenantales bacterium]
MGLRRKEIVTMQKASFEKNLKDRLARLAEKEIKDRPADKDPLVRKLKADIKATAKRLRKIVEDEKRTAEMARIKAEKAAAPKKEPEKAKAEKPKAGAKEAKPKKPKAPEGAKPQKKAEPPAEGKPAESQPAENKPTEGKPAKSE